MGMCCWTVCRDCDAEAPQLGDFGYLGYPSLEERANGSAATTFGAIYRGLAAVHLVTEEIDDFRRFLERHAGHRVVTENQEGLIFGDDGQGGALPSSAVRAGAADSDGDEDEEDESEGTDEDEDEPEAVFIKSRYRASCRRCGESVATGDLYPLSPFMPAPLSAAAIRAFQDTVMPAIETDCYEAAPLYVGDLARLDTFFASHSDHEIVVELTASLAD